MNEPTQEQTKEFWEWCGFEYDDDWADDRPYKDPQGIIQHHGTPIDLNNLFKYAVPIVLSKMSWTDWFHFMVSWAIKIYDKKDPALALFWALWQVKEASK